MITNKMRAKIPYGSNYWLLTDEDIFTAHIDTYQELWDETGDEYFEFLKKFAETRQYR